MHFRPAPLTVIGGTISGLFGIVAYPDTESTEPLPNVSSLVVNGRHIASIIADTLNNVYAAGFHNGANEAASVTHNQEQNQAEYCICCRTTIVKFDDHKSWCGQQ